MIALGDPIPAAERQKDFHCIYLFFLFISYNFSDLHRKQTYSKRISAIYLQCLMLLLLLHIYQRFYY